MAGRISTHLTDQESHRKISNYTGIRLAGSHGQPIEVQKQTERRKLWSLTTASKWIQAIAQAIKSWVHLISSHLCLERKIQTEVRCGVDRQAESLLDGTHVHHHESKIWYIFGVQGCTSKLQSDPDKWQWERVLFQGSFDWRVRKGEETTGENWALRFWLLPEKCSFIAEMLTLKPF